MRGSIISRSLESDCRLKANGDTRKSRDPIPNRMSFAAVYESADGTKRTFPSRRFVSAFGGKADMRILGLHQRVDPLIQNRLPTR